MSYLEISLLRSVTVAEPFLSTVMSAEVSRRFRILDMKSVSGRRAFPPPAKLRPRSASVPRRGTSPEPVNKVKIVYNNLQIKLN
jgi:hypothetical protein